ncbi:hypothetical protein GCM10010515_43440 [Streptomyces fructofermentans]|uniref:Uncharacterized protein n=1 Tax=Streptomyces fructofermentans TaxID=152141 RepID=A0A918KPR8_9ACTN|nr:hypothetical protein GCM10010515_43440 [Streptomyces fructofermentans]
MTHGGPLDVCRYGELCRCSEGSAVLTARVLPAVLCGGGPCAGRGVGLFLRVRVRVRARVAVVAVAVRVPGFEAVERGGFGVRRLLRGLAVPETGGGSAGRRAMTSVGSGARARVRPRSVAVRRGPSLLRVAVA